MLFGSYFLSILHSDRVSVCLSVCLLVGLHVCVSVCLCASMSVSVRLQGLDVCESVHTGISFFAVWCLRLVSGGKTQGGDPT